MFGRNPPLILKQYLQSNNSNLCYDLRSNNINYFISDKIFTKYGELTLKNFYSKFLNTVNFMEFNRNFQACNHDRLFNHVIYADLSKLIKTFPKFNCNIDFYFFRI